MNFLSEDEVVLFPSDELLRAETLSSSKEMMAQRLYAMGQLTKDKNQILITHPSALLRFLPDKKSFKQFSLFLEVGQKASLEEIKGTLTQSGYSRVNKIDQSLQFAVRGDILDIFSVNHSRPVRIEFFDDEIESIKYFDIASQSSSESLRSIEILPGTETFLSDCEIDDFKKRIFEVAKKDEESLSESQKDSYESSLARDLEDISSRNYRSTLYRYYGFALNRSNSILSYFDVRSVFVTDKDLFKKASDQIEEEARAFYHELNENQKLPSRLSQYMRVEEAFRGLSVSYGSQFSTSRDDDSFLVRHIVSTGSGISSIASTIESYLSSGSKVILAVNEEQQRKSLLSLLGNLKIDFELLKGFDLPTGQVGVTSERLSEGFEIPSLHLVYLSSSDIFGKRSVATRFSSRFKNATILKSYQDLKPGDYVVHEYNGIGQFIQVKTMETEGIHRDYLEISYAKNDRLFVPLEQFKLVRKYAGREGYAPRLSSLYSGEWEKRKNKIKSRINDLADRLIALYGERAKAKGYAFPPDDEFQRQFEAEFPHELTPDQSSSLAQIKSDMESPSPMDRLLCGDVGFGKTEIAFRAAFKAISSGKQVAFLAPTTLLARQHYEVAIQRFATFGVHIGLLSRMVPSSTQRLVEKSLSDGQCDMVIGTHKLLSKKIVFKDLGLLIVDEEQRFGVEQKERIKELKKDLDVLSLSATPIPRTLQMSLIGIRPVSTINTPPDDRLPIQTYVAPYREDVVYELIERELARDGQVFYIHNNVSTIYSVGHRIARNVSFAKIGIVHGKMDRAETEEVMQLFYDGEINVLIATSIVENGIDVPNANMIIVEDADRFGLSQLYQIKGRVGRGGRVAYAYLLYRPDKTMNEDALKRLKAIQDFTELGSGYKIAERDLMIRGAGDILGSEQAGFIDSVGLDLYMQLLNETVEEKKTGIKKAEPKPKTLFNIDAYIPKSYAITSDKIELYQDIENASDEMVLEEVAKHIRDVYGKLPLEVELLITEKKINLLSENVEFFKIEQGEGYVDILLSDQFSKIPHIAVDMFDVMIPFLQQIKVNFIDKRVHIRLFSKDNNKWIDDLLGILNAIHKLYLARSKDNQNANR